MYAGTLLDIAMTHADSLIERARNGDEHACNKLVKLWYKRIYNFSMKYLGQHDLASEVTQKTFISMYKNLTKLEDTKSFKSWLYRIASNNCHEEYRRQLRYEGLYQDDAEDESKALPISPDIEKTMHDGEVSELLGKSLLALSPEQREVVIMKEFEGLKFREIAEVLNISENTVKSRLYYALRHLKQIFDERHITKETFYYEG